MSAVVVRDVAIAAILRRERTIRRARAGRAIGIAVVVLACAWATGLLDGPRLARGVPAIAQLVSELIRELADSKSGRLLKDVTYEF